MSFELKNYVLIGNTGVRFKSNLFFHYWITFDRNLLGLRGRFGVSSLSNDKFYMSRAFSRVLKLSCTINKSQVMTEIKKELP